MCWIGPQLQNRQTSPGNSVSRGSTPSRSGPMRAISSNPRSHRLRLHRLRLIRKIPFPPDREIFQYDGSHQLLLEYQLVTDRPIRVDEIRLPGAGRYAPVRVIEVDWRPSGTYIDRPGRGPPPRPKYRAWQPSVVEPRFDGIWVRLRLRFHNCEHLQSPGSISYNQLRVRYHALGRERTAMINLYRPLAITGAAPDDCARWAAGGR